jgi:hypothetical protein
MNMMGAKTTRLPKVTLEVGAVTLEHPAVCPCHDEGQLEDVARLESGRLGVEYDERDVFESDIGSRHGITVRGGCVPFEIGE